MSTRRGKLMHLEAARGFAAFYVFLGHFKALNSLPISPLLRFGQEAVMLFFVLSGFVIYYTTLRTGERLPFRTYLVHRVRRIYPIFLIAILLSYVSASYARHALANVNWYELMGNLVMMQDGMGVKRGVWFDTFAGNTALWSLSYEWWFYLLFYGVICISSNGAAQRAIAFALTVVGAIYYQIFPNQLCLYLGYFYIWWSGVELARQYCLSGEISFTGQRMNLLLLSLVALLWSVPMIVARVNGQPLVFGVDPVLQFRHAAVATLLVLFALAWYRKRVHQVDVLLGWVSMAAPISYAFYVFHRPMITIIETTFPNLWLPIQLIILLGLLVPLCYLAEVVLQRAINRLSSRWFLTNSKPRTQLAA